MVKLLIGVYYRIVNVKLLYVFNIYYFFVGCEILSWMNLKLIDVWIIKVRIIYN